MSPHFLAGSMPSPATLKSVPVPLHAIVNIRLKCGHMSYVSKQIHARDNVVAPFIIISIIIVTLPVTTLHCLRLFGEVQNSFAIPLYAAQHFPTNTVTLSFSWHVSRRILLSVCRALLSLVWGSTVLQDRRGGCQEYVDGVRWARGTHHNAMDWRTSADVIGCQWNCITTTAVLQSSSQRDDDGNSLQLVEHAASEVAVSGSNKLNWSKCRIVVANEFASASVQQSSAACAVIDWHPLAQIAATTSFFRNVECRSQWSRLFRFAP